MVRQRAHRDNGALASRKGRQDGYGLGAGAMTRHNFLSPPQFYNLDLACRAIVDVFDWTVYLVGSCLTRADYRDVDVRCILEDERFDRMFPGTIGAEANCRDPLWNLLCVSISSWLAQRTGLNIDFQFQRQTNANAEFSHKNGHDRVGIGVHIHSLLEDVITPTPAAPAGSDDGEPQEATGSEAAGQVLPL